MHPAGLFLISVLLLVGCAKRSLPVPSPASDDRADIESQVHSFCGHCHAYPPPDIFPREHWRAEVERGYRFFEKSTRNLKPPPLASVVAYYEERAPVTLPPAKVIPAAHSFGARFERVPLGAFSKPSAPFAISHVNLVSLRDPNRLDILACDMRNGQVMLLQPYEPTPTWRVLALVPNPAHAEVVDLDGDGVKDILVANLGSFVPTDRRCGSVVWLRGRADGSFTPIPLLEGVGRVADVQAAAFRENGKLDLIVAVFGWQETGEVLFLENQTTDWSKPRFVPRVVDDRHGTIHVPIADLNGDGKLDFVALISQEHEAILAFLNEDEGRFRKQTLYQAPHPGFGSSGLQLVDIDGDGRLDILYTNGDVLDEPHLYKPYHGIQWLRNKGNLEFEPRLLSSMYGAHHAVAGDLDGDGDVDIVAVSFLPESRFPNRKERGADAIVVLEQTTKGAFARHSLMRGECDHVSCAVGDLFARGKLDLVVGNFDAPNAVGPVTIWRNRGK
jgi:hypothetical protein